MSDAIGITVICAVLVAWGGAAEAQGLLIAAAAWAALLAVFALFHALCWAIDAVKRARR